MDGYPKAHVSEELEWASRDRHLANEGGPCTSHNSKKHIPQTLKMNPGIGASPYLSGKGRVVLQNFPKKRRGHE